MSRELDVDLDRAGHLSEEAFARLMLGEEASGGAAVHVSQCSRCRGELERFAAGVREFRGAALGWSEARRPMSWQQQVRRTAGAPVSKSKRRLVAATCAMAAGAVLAVGVSAWGHREGVEMGAGSAGGVTAVLPEAAAGEASRETEIAEDNKLMRDVNLAIRRDDASAVRAYGLTVEARGPGRSSLETRSQ